MKFTILERMLMLHLLPREHNIVMLREARKLREQLSISEKENKKVDMRMCSDWVNGCPRCGSTKTEIEKENNIITPRRTCKDCGLKGAQGVNGDAMWHELPEPTDIKISNEMKNQIAGALKALNKQNKIKEGHISIYEKFVEEIDQITDATLIH